MMLSGGFAGFCYANVAFIPDLLKVRKQYIETKPKSYLEEISHIYRKEGLRGFFRGYLGNVLRDGPGYAWYFTFYEWSKRKCGVSDAVKETTAYKSMSKSEVSLALFFCGGFSG